MKTKSIAVLIFITFLFSGSSLFAQGESAVPFLLIAPGAKEGGMGEAGVALANGATAVYWNPAGLAFQFNDPENDSRGEVSFMHAKWLPQFNFNDLFYDFLAARYYLDELEGMVGLSITYLNLGENVYTDEQGNNLGNFDSFEYAIAASYATLLKENLSLGLNLKLIQSNLVPDWVDVGAEKGSGVATGFAVDLGVIWVPSVSFFDNRLRLGANLSNFGPKITYVNEAQADPLPTNLRMGLAYEAYNDGYNQINIVYDTNRLLVVRDSTESDNVFKAVFYSSWVEGKIEDRLKKFTHSIGAEYIYNNLIALRAGYFYEDEKFGARQFATFGGGINYSIFSVDFSYVAAAEDHPLSDTMRFSLAVRF